MLTTISHNSKNFKVDLSQPLDISIPLKFNENNLEAWSINKPKKETIFDVYKGDVVNFNTLTFNPHAHGTHTESVGHITSKFISVNKQLKHYFFIAEVISVAPEKAENDLIISKEQIQFLLKGKQPEALVIRTMPNTKDKKNKEYSNTNWPYLTEDAATYIRQQNIAHLLVDLPSVDKEKDEGKLLAHKAFWNFNGALRKQATITEFIYVSNKILDGAYILNLQIAPLKNDASPSKPVLYKIIN